MNSEPLMVCAGMRRSGSTLQAQLVAELVGADAIELIGPEGQIPTAPPDSRTRVLKCHRYVPALAHASAEGRARVFYTYRDIRDVFASTVQKYGSSPVSFLHGGAARILREYAEWSAVPGVYVAQYEVVIGDLAGEVRRLSAALGRPVDEARARDIAAKFSVERQRERIARAFADDGDIAGTGNNAHDRATLLHRNHIQSGGSGDYRRVLGWREVAAVEWICRDWMRARGYVPDHPIWRQFIAYAGFQVRSRLHGFKQWFQGKGG